MKKVLIVACDGFSKSGVPNVFVNIIREMSKQGYSFDVLYFDENMPYYKSELQNLGCKLIYSDFYKRKNKIGKLIAKYRATKMFSKIIKEYGPYDCVDSFKGFESGYVMKAAYKSGIKNRIVHLGFIYKESHNSIIRHFEKKERKLIEKHSSFIVCDSSKTQHNIPNSHKTIVIKPFYDRFFKYSEYKGNNDSISLVQIGSYSSNKNQLFSLKILKDIIKQYPKSILHFIGFNNSQDPSYFNELKEAIEDDGLINNVILHPFDENAVKLFEQCSYLLFPSISESFGIVPVEAQASGLTCLCSDTVTTENNAGGCYYLPLNNKELWVQTILEDFKKTKGEHRHFDLLPFSSSEIIKKYQALYQGDIKTN